MHWRRKWQPTPVFLPGESQGRGSLVAAVYGVTQSRTRLKWLSSSSSIGHTLSLTPGHWWPKTRSLPSLSVMSGRENRNNRHKKHSCTFPRIWQRNSMSLKPSRRNKRFRDYQNLNTGLTLVKTLVCVCFLTMTTFQQEASIITLVLYAF